MENFSSVLSWKVMIFIHVALGITNEENLEISVKVPNTLLKQKKNLYYGTFFDGYKAIGNMHFPA